MKTKTIKGIPRDFDCVAMKEAAAAEIYELTKDMSLEEKVEFWRKQTGILLAEQRAAKRRLRGKHRK